MIGPAGPDRAGRLAATHAAAFEEGWSAAAIAGLIRQGATALASDHGFILIRAAGGEAEILTLAVEPAARRQGAGRQLVLAGMEAARAAGAAELFLEVAADNAAALALYRGCEFVEVGLRRGYYRRGAGPAVDALVLRRALTSVT